MRITLGQAVKIGEIAAARLRFGEVDARETVSVEEHGLSGLHVYSVKLLPQVPGCAIEEAEVCHTFDDLGRPIGKAEVVK